MVAKHVPADSAVRALRDGARSHSVPGDALLSGLRDAIFWEADPVTLQVAFVSESASSILGHPVSQWTGEPAFLEHHVHPDDREEFVSGCLEAAEFGEGRVLLHRMIAADGRIVWLRGTAYPLTDAEGNRRLYGLVFDITEHRRTERRLSVQYEVTKILAEAKNLDDAAPRILRATCAGLVWDVGQLWMVEPGGDVLTLRHSVNHADIPLAAFQTASRERTFERGIGLPGRVWASGAPYWIVDVAADPNFPRANSARDADLRSGLGFPVWFGGRVFGVMEFFSRVRQEPDDDLLNALASLGSRIGQFIERKRVEEELSGRERRTRVVLEELGLAVYTTDAEGRITFYNEAAVAIWGRRPELGRDEWCGSLRLFWPDGRPMAHAECPMARALQEERAVRGIEAVAERPDGSRVTFMPYPTPLHDASGRLIGAVNVLVDTTDRALIEQELRDSERRIRLAMDAGGMGAWDWNVLTGEVRWSEGLEAMHGLEPGSFGGTVEAFQQDLHPSDKDALLARIQDALTLGSYDVEYRIIRTDSAVRWVAASGQVIYDEDGRPVRMLGVCTDVTDRKSAMERQRLLAEAGAVLASTLDYDTLLERLAGLIAGSMADWCAIDLLEDDGSVRRLVLAYGDPAKQDVARRLEQYVPDTSGVRGIIEDLSSGRGLLFRELSEEQIASAALDETHHEIMRELGLTSAMIVPLFARGKVLGAITFVLTGSGQRYGDEDLGLAEELAYRATLAVDNARLYGASQRIQEELRKANEAKDEFLGLISHELRTPITTIYGGTRLLRARGAALDEETRRQVLEDITGETDRLRRIVEDLLVLARAELGQEPAREPVLLQRTVSELVQSFAERHPERPVEIAIDSDLEPTAAETTYLDQVMRNLLSNAHKYSPAGKPIEVCVERMDGEAIVKVLDRGVGIQLGEEESIFERFYRSPDSKRKAQGMGLGLTVCKRLIDAQGGRIWARPREGGGLEVGFALPFYGSQPAQ